MFTDPTGLYYIYKSFDAKNLKHRYGFGFPIMTAVVTRHISNFLPFGGYLANMQNSLLNTKNRITGNSYRIIYDSDESRFSGFNTAMDVISITPLGQGSKVIQGLSKSLSIVGESEDVIDYLKDDKPLHDFLKEVRFNLFRSVETDEEAKIVADAIVLGAAIYKSKDLGQYGISENAWAKAVKDKLYDRPSELYDSIICDGEASE